jgi:uncharacterized protein (TIGR00730 family)
VKRICVYAGSNAGARIEYADAARKTASHLVDRGIDVVYGGGNVGLMKIVADTAMAAGGKVIGVIPDALVAREVGHRDVTELRIVASMHERKALMADLSDGFIALPGGFGTLEEFVEIATWAQLGLHTKPFGLLNVAGYYDDLVGFFDRATSEGFLHPKHRRMLLVADDPASLLDAFENWKSAYVRKWIDRDAT